MPSSLAVQLLVLSTILTGSVPGGMVLEGAKRRGQRPLGEPRHLAAMLVKKCEHQHDPRTKEGFLGDVMYPSKNEEGSSSYG